MLRPHPAGPLRRLNPGIGGAGLIPGTIVRPIPRLRPLFYRDCYAQVGVILLAIAGLDLGATCPARAVTTRVRVFGGMIWMPARRHISVVRTVGTHQAQGNGQRAPSCTKALYPYVK